MGLQNVVEIIGQTGLAFVVKPEVLSDGSVVYNVHGWGFKFGARDRRNAEALARQLNKCSFVQAENDNFNE